MKLLKSVEVRYAYIGEKYHGNEELKAEVSELKHIINDLEKWLKELFKNDEEFCSASQKMSSC